VPDGPVKTGAHRPLRIEPLQVRVDRNRFRFFVFLVAFVTGSAVILGLAFVAVPGSLIGLVVDSPHYYGWLGVAVAASIGLLLIFGGIAAGVQVANAEHWVRSRFKGTELDPAAHPALVRAVDEMSVAAGLPGPPRLLLLDVPSVNACAIGTSRKQPIIGVTRGFLDAFTPDEQRAVVAMLMARITRGDIFVGTALAALMGPLKYLRSLRKAPAAAAGAVDGAVDGGCAANGCAGLNGCGDLGDGCSGIGDNDSCSGTIALVLFIALVAALTWVAIIVATWLVTAWGRALQRTGHEKADAEGMLLLRDPQPMLSALRKAISSSNEIADGDASYDGIFYASTSGTPAIEKVERRRYDRLREVLGTEGLAAPLLDGSDENG
jgi:Zn-dependent protease with chaperone function